MQDPVEVVQVNGEFVGVLFKDEGRRRDFLSAFNMAILEMDLPELPAGRA